MEFNPIFVGQLSACFELINDSVYFAQESFDVKVNGEVVHKNVKTNVFSIYGLKPDTDYVIEAGGFETDIHTLKASIIMHIKDFANPSKTSDDTLMIQAAINMLPENGILFIDKGEYHITSIFLKSDMTLYLDKGAVILGNTDMDAYPICPGEEKYTDESKNELQLMTWEGRPYPTKTAFVSGYHLHNVTIDGEGEFNGQADKSPFWIDVKKMTIGRPRMVFMNDCVNFVMHGVKVSNSPSWTIHPYFSNKLGFYDIKIFNPKDAPNTDGMDPECCQDVNVIGVYFSVGDDCIALKSGKIYIGQKYKVASDRTLIRNCYMHEGHGALVLGSEIGAGVKNIKVERCYFEHTDRGMRIKTRRGRGKDCVIDGVEFNNIIMDKVLTPLVVNMYYFCDPDGHTEYVYSREKHPVDDNTPHMGSFVFNNIQATDAEYALGWFYGLPEMPIDSITVSNSSFTVKKDASSGMPAMMDGIEKQCKSGFNFCNVRKVHFHNVKATGFEGEEFIKEGVDSFTAD